MSTILSIGEVLWDCFDDGERLGGAPLNLAIHARRMGDRAFVVSAVGDDRRGRLALRAMRRERVDTRFVATVARPGTGRVTVTLGRRGEPAYVIHRPAAYDRLNAHEARLTAIRPDAVCFGTLAAARPGPRAVLSRVLPPLTAGGAIAFYDVNLREGCWDDELVRWLLQRAAVAKMNQHEATEVARLTKLPARPLHRFCAALAERFRLRAVCVTRGARGCVLFVAGSARGAGMIEHGGYKVRVADTVGAGDAFAAALLHGLAEHWPPRRVASFACRIGALVASLPGAVPDWSEGEALGLRSRGIARRARTTLR